MTVRPGTPPRQLHQDRARETRAHLVDAAAKEFAARGYAAASINAILADSGHTKGAMYFHFPSKAALAQAVLDDAETIYADIGAYWRCEKDLHPFAALAGIVDDIAASFADNPIMRSDARMSLEPDFYPRIEYRGSRAWEPAGLDLAADAHRRGLLKPEFTPEKLIRVLAAMLSGQHYLAELIPGEPVLRERFTESLDTVIAAMTTTDHRKYRSRG